MTYNPPTYATSKVRRTMEGIQTPAAHGEKNTETLTAIVREKIEQMILGGQIKAGERLTESALAGQLNVSRGPIREATRLLAEAGLVTMVRNRGAFVREVSLEDILHVYDVRAGLARVAGRLAAMRATSDQIAELKALLEGMESARVVRDTDTYIEINRRFHAKIVESTANPRLIDFHQTTERELFLFTRRGVLGPRRLDRSNREHELILEALAKGDELGAARAFENHVLTGKQRMLDTLSWRELT